MRSGETPSSGEIQRERKSRNSRHVQYNAERSRQGYSFCMSLMKDENRKAFKAIRSRGVLKKYPLTPEQTNALKRDYNRMLELGGNIYSPPSSARPTGTRSATSPP